MTRNVSPIAHRILVGFAMLALRRRHWGKYRLAHTASERAQALAGQTVGLISHDRILNGRMP